MRRLTLLPKLAYKARWYYRKFLVLIGVKRTYSINGSLIRIEHTHKLPDYQKTYPYYDKFLPHLAKYLPENSVVVDVGANVGDTLAGMASINSNLEYLCIEASREFFAYLSDNVRLLKSQKDGLRISLVNEFVGKDITNVSLDGKGGTKHAVVGGGEIQSKEMLSILKDTGIAESRVSLLKTDVDGFDWDVLRSSYATLSHHPYIFFEWQYANSEQLGNYKETFGELIDIGYSRFAFFDNFGQYILSTDQLPEIFELLDYVMRQNAAQSTRTMFYYDVLAYPAAYTDAVAALIAEYNTTQ